MLIGIGGPQGCGKQIAAEWLAEQLGFTLVRIADEPDLLSAPVPGGNYVVPDIIERRDVAQVRRHGRMVFMLSRGDAEPGAIDATQCGPEGRDFLVSDYGGMSDLHAALEEVVVAVRRLLKDAESA